MQVTVRTRGKLPHWSRPGADYFITFRTAGSISPEALAALRVSRYTPDERRRSIELALDRADFGDILRGEVAAAVAQSIRYGHRRNYLLDCWCVMPNHVHLLLREFDGTCLAWAMQTLKSYSAHQVNRLLNRRGRVWEREYFDRIARAGQVEGIRKYILRNPIEARLQNWAWVGSAVADETSALQP